VPNDVHEAKAQQCRNLDIRNLHDVRLDISAAGTTMGRNLGNVALRASGASRVQLEQVQSLNAYLSGASGVVAHSIGAGTHVSAQGASSADIRSAQGRLTGDARGASRIRAQGAFPAIELQASGASNIEIANALAVRPHARASGASLVRVNGRNVAGGYLRGPPYNRKSSCLLIGVSHDTP
jgi:hypothetical protein